MAKPTTARGTKVRLLLGNGATPEVFAALCGITAKTITFQKNTNEFFVADCDNPDDPAWRDLVASGKFISISGEGLLDTLNAFPTMRAAWDDDLAINARLYIDVPAASGGGYWSGAWMVTQLTIGGNDDGLTTTGIQLESHGTITWVPAV